MNFELVNFFRIYKLKSCVFMTLHNDFECEMKKKKPEKLSFYNLVSTGLENFKSFKKVRNLRSSSGNSPIYPSSLEKKIEFD